MTQRHETTGVPSEGRRNGNDCLDLRLYVVDETPRCLTAYENIRKICEQYAGNRYRITVLDIRKHPELARADDITAIPTLIRVPREPGRRKIIGMLSDTGKVLEELDLPQGDRQFLNAGRIMKRSSATMR